MRNFGLATEDWPEDEKEVGGLEQVAVRAGAGKFQD